MSIQLSPLDEERFGIPSARATAPLIANDIPTALDFCHKNRVKFLFARCFTSDLAAAQAMERAGFLLMDTLLYFERRLPFPIPDTETTLRPVKSSEAQIVAQLATESFRGYGGHYHSDPRLDVARSDEVYSSWAYRSCMSREVADEVLVAEIDSQIVGFVTLKVNSPLEGEVPLYGVSPAVQGQGIGRGLIIGALKWCTAQKVERLLISTQVTNLSSQKVWIRLGFEPTHSYYTFHKWFD
ncbi:MAG: GNAT family N-acetyltransferase [Anaerolineae bacterium]